MNFRNLFQRVKLVWFLLFVIWREFIIHFWDLLSTRNDFKNFWDCFSDFELEIFWKIPHKFAFNAAHLLKHLKFVKSNWFWLTDTTEIKIVINWIISFRENSENFKNQRYYKVQSEQIHWKYIELSRVNFILQFLTLRVRLNHEF